VEGTERPQAPWAHWRLRRGVIARPTAPAKGGARPFLRSPLHHRQIPPCSPSPSSRPWAATASSPRAPEKATASSRARRGGPHAPSIRDRRPPTSSTALVVPVLRTDWMNLCLREGTAVPSPTGRTHVSHAAPRPALAHEARQGNHPYSHQHPSRGGRRTRVAVRASGRRRCRRCTPGGDGGGAGRSADPASTPDAGLCCARTSPASTAPPQPRRALARETTSRPGHRSMRMRLDGAVSVPPHPIGRDGGTAPPSSPPARMGQTRAPRRDMRQVELGLRYDARQRLSKGSTRLARRERPRATRRA